MHVTNFGVSQYKIELNLQRMAMVSTAVSLWELPHNKNKITEFCKPPTPNCCKDVQWNSLTYSIAQQLGQNVLPQPLENELICTIRSIGEKICNWNKHIRNYFASNEEVPVDCVDKFCWTHYGTIDEKNTFELFWLENDKIDIIKVYHLACEYTLEKHINNLWSRIPKKIQDKFYEESYKTYKGLILAYWNYRRNGDLLQMMNYFEFTMRSIEEPEFYDLLYDRHESVEENMFKLSAYNGYNLAVEYFWHRLNEEERERNLLEATQATIFKSSYCGWKCSHKKEKYLEVSVFLINQMKASYREELYEEQPMEYYNNSYNKTRHKYTFLCMLLNVWPWHEFFIPTLKDMWGYFEEDGFSCAELLFLLTSMVIRNYLGYSVQTDKYRGILNDIWPEIPMHFKVKIGGSYSILHLICVLLDIRNLLGIKLATLPPELTSKREKLKFFEASRFVTLLLNGELSCLDQFVEEIVCLCEEKNLKEKIKKWEQFLTKSCCPIRDEVHISVKQSIKQSVKQSIKQSVKESSSVALDPPRRQHSSLWKKITAVLFFKWNSMREG